jgi:molybdopterin molybdotransferase
MALLSVDDALALVVKGLTPLEVETVPIAEAHGRVLGETLAATLTQPPFDASAMDGYAVRAADVAALPATLELIGEAAAGARFAGRLKPGQAVRIFTGAPVPDGADTIVIQEDTEERDGRVVVKAAAPGRHIRPRGQDFMQGEALLEQGTVLGARALMLAASMNHAEIPVRRKPQVAILATGDEVVPPGSQLGPDEIVSSVGYGIAALVAAHGGEAVDLGIARDDPESIATLASTGAGADILVTIGGASVGERDLVVTALEREGLKLEFAKVAMRPGKPVLFGRLGGQRFLGVPGNPVSALICSIVFLVPMLRVLLGVGGGDRPLAKAVLAEDLPPNGPRRHYLRALSSRAEDGTRIVRPLPSQDSSLVAALAKADCLIVRGPEAPGLPAGTLVKILPFAD